jgi:phage-related protein
MARFTIYSKDGQIKRHEGEPQYSGSYMGVDFVEFRTISSPTPIDWQIGDYVDYYRTGKRYRLYSLPMPKKVARKGEYGASFEYSNVQLYGATKELEIAPFRDLVPKDNKIHFSTRQDVSTYENVYGIARRIQECMDDLYPNKWRIEVYDTDDTDLRSLFEEIKEYSVSSGSCLDALSQIYETWKNVGWIHTYDSANKVDVITIGRANVRNADNTSDSFAHGVGKGLTSIKKASANKDEFATRLYIYGSERNIQTRYYNGLDILNKDSVDIRNLMIPTSEWGKTNGLPDASKAYLQADDATIEKYGLIPRTVYFDGNGNEEIYPSIQGLLMSEVRLEMILAGQGASEYLPDDLDIRIDRVGKAIEVVDAGTKEDMEYIPTFTLSLPKVGFDIVEQGKQTSAGYATISMKSGKCAGRDFKVKKNFKTLADTPQGCWTYELERSWDDSLGMGFPNYLYNIEAGDEFVLLDIPMPEYYITLAEKKLLEAGRKMLSDYTKVSAFYEPIVDSIKIKEGGKLLQAGMFMQVYDEDIIDTADKKDYVLIDTLTIDEKSDLPIYRVTLREQKRSARTYSALEDMIEDARESNKQEISRVRQYTDRRFRSAQETLEMLQAAFSNFSDGISPVTIRTMSMLVGDEGLQYKFTAASNSLADIACPFSYDEATKQMKSMVSYLKHMTLGIKTITTGAMSASSYKTWRIPAWASAVLDDGAKSYYVYVKASQANSTSECLLSETPIGMEDVSGYYHFLVGILNSELNGKRDFVTLYGFTEVLPGQITTDIIRSGNGGLIIDLVNAVIEAKNGATIKGSLTIGSGSSGLGNLDEWSEKQEQIDNANQEAQEANRKAQAAQSVADSATSKLNEWANDNVISPLEKQGLKNEISFIKGDYNDILASYTKYIQEFDRLILSDGKQYITADGYIFNIEIANENWINYESAYRLYLSDLENKTKTSDTVAVGNLAELQYDFYTKRTAILEDISLAIKSEADYAVKRANSAISDTVALKTYVDTVKQDLLDQIDGAITNWFGEEEPTLGNYPAKDWTTNEIKDDHLGDLYYSGTGKVYRFQKSASGEYEWKLIPDNDLAQALELAQKAQDTADGKRRIFIIQPFAPYDAGDLWAGGENYPLKVCRTPKEAGEAFDSSDWVLADNSKSYTDSLVNSTISSLNKAIEDTQKEAKNYTDEGKAALQKSIDALNEAKADLEDVYDKAETDKKITVSESAAIARATELAEEAKNAAQIYAEAYADGKIDEKEQEILDEADRRLSEAKKNLQDAIDGVTTSVENVRQMASEAQSIANSARQELEVWANDSVISPVEKQGLKNELAFIEADYQDIYKNYQKYIQEFTEYILSDDRTYVTSDGFVFNIEVAYDNWEIFDNAYDIYRADLRNKINTSGDVAIGELEQYQSSFYSARTEMLDAISLAIKAETDYGVTNSDRAIEEVNKKANEIIGQLNEAEGQLRQAIEDAEGSANDYTDEVKQTLQTALKNLDEAKASVASVNAIVSEDGLISAAEKRAIQEAEELAKAAEDAAKQAAEGYATKEGQKAIAEANKALEMAKKELADAIAEVEEIANSVDAATESLNTRIADVETNVEESVAEINARLDGVVENYFYEGVPTTSNYPAMLWITDDERKNHIGDTYTNISSFDQDPDNAGKSWRWTYTDTEHTGYHWHPIADSDAVKALLEASKVQAVADGKSSTFINEPKPPYSEGDLWVQGASGDIYRCIKTRESGSYTASDWEIASKYTDDTKANEALTAANNAQAIASSATSKLNQWSADNVISPLEKQGLKDEIAFIKADYNDISLQYEKYIQEFDRLILSDGKQYITEDGYVFNIEVANTNWEAYKSAYNAYKTDLESKTADNETVAIGNLVSLQASFYNKRTAILEDISLSIKAEADYSKKTAQEASKDVSDLQEKVKSDYDYLTDIFGKGKNLNVEGVVMSKMVAVNNGEDDVEAFLNGSDFAEDKEEHGKLILAAGIPEDGGDLEQRSKEASTRIYEDGCTFTKNMHLDGGCTIGDDLEIVAVKTQIEGGNTEESDDDVFKNKCYIQAKDFDNNFLGASFSSSGISVTGQSIHSKRWQSVHIDNGCAGRCVGIRIEEITTKIPVGDCIVDDKPIGLDIYAPDSYGIYARAGQFAGFRPKTRVITTSTPTADRTLTELDHTIIINIGSGSVTIKTPSAPQDGQVYEIYTCHHTMGLTIDFNGEDAYSFIEATNKPSDTFAAGYRRHITLIYAEGQWWEDYRYLQ